MNLALEALRGTTELPRPDRNIMFYILLFCCKDYRHILNMTTWYSEDIEDYTLFREQTSNNYYWLLLPQIVFRATSLSSSVIRALGTSFSHKWY
jgi:hypothetical protein